MKKNISNFVALLFVLFVFGVNNVIAQEIEVTNSELYLRSANTYNYLKFYENGLLFLELTGSAPSNDAFLINVNSSSNRAIVARNRWASPAIFEVYGTGLVYANGLALTSDSTAKADIRTLDSQIENLRNLKPISYRWKDKAEKGDKKSYGLLAQDLEKVYPDMVFTDEDGYKAIYYTELIPVLINVTKEQQALIEDLEKRLEILEKKAGK